MFFLVWFFEQPDGHALIESCMLALLFSFWHHMIHILTGFQMKL